MAHLDVQRRKKSPTWIWLIIALLALAVILFFLLNSSSDKDHKIITATDTIAATTPRTIAAAPDWNDVDFNAPDTNYEEVTDKGIVIRSKDKYIIYSLGGNILFATDKSTLQGAAADQLKQVAASLNKRFKNAAIGVYGHADDNGTRDHNTQLAAERAAAVKIWLIEKGGIDENKISIHTLGASKPIASNASAAGRQQNRSVEIVVFSTK
jgi:outer membrane protein OmpA-like peptidoglycan-associated protein